MATDLRKYFKTAPKRIIVDTFGAGDFAFEVTINACTRQEMDAMRATATVRAFDKTTRQFAEQTDLKRIRDFLAKQCVGGWSGLTGRKALHWANLAPTGMPEDDEDVPFSTEQATALMESCLQFENWVFQTATDLADVIAKEEAVAKNA